ncbi:hypothetical protein [Paraburkholderia phenazinium]|uniref:Lipoprotein n=1 Tax=Paraburkholderia phenazinium TaxID=60549 RepID=A0A1N6KGQ2_9BURK|nr:hypothetical protein [Paraburkholderia phenazinium]SIO55527.1 hypothetical protein SAMN05444165_3571 [Paraburkholderia phenazinium]
MTMHKTQKRPTLMLIGAAGTLAGAGLIAGCHNDTPVQVERAEYASQADCERDWNRPDDCALLADGGQPASGTSSSSGTSGSAGGAHGGGGGAHWYGPYYTKSGKVYHADGDETDEIVRASHSTQISESTHSEGALTGHGGGEEGISRGGFGESAHAGGGEGGHGG